jgi:proline iminopeptidase
MEKLRKHLEVERWQVLGGSWGSTLALAYAETFPQRVTELVVRGIFTLRRQELQWFYQRGADAIYPDEWENYVAVIPEAERGDMIKAYYRRLTSALPEEQLRAARAWSKWEGATLSLLPDPNRVAEFGGDRFALAFARIECHYFANGGFFERDDWLLAQAGRLKDIPGVIIQGRYDVVTPMETAWALHKEWPEAEFIVVPDAGHTATEPGLADALIRTTDRFAHASGA